MGVLLHRLILVLLFLTATTFMFSDEAVSIQTSYGYSILAPSKAVFLEHNMIANGTVINGSAPFRTTNFPTYWFNENTRELNGNIDFPINSSLKVIFGDILTLQGNFGSGTGNKLYGIYSLPVHAGPAILFQADPYGTVGLYVNNQTVYLRPGQSYTYLERETLREDNGTVKVVYNHMFTNHGIIDKNIIGAKMVR